MPELPKLPPLPKLPRLPRLPQITQPVEDFHGLFTDVRQSIGQAQEGIRDVASSLHPATSESKPYNNLTSSPRPAPQSSTPSPVAQGTACNLCSMEHFSQSAGALSEAMRFARTDGLTHPEVVKRIGHASKELNTMERFDLAPSEMVKLKGPERQLAEWAVTNSRDLRHLINRAIASRGVGDLEKAAAQAEVTAQEFLKRVMALPPQKEKCEPCGQLDSLKKYVAEKKRALGSGKSPIEYHADSSEFLAQTIDATGYREKLDRAFKDAIARAKR